MAIKKTLVIGASSNPERYSYKAVKSLLNHNIEVVALAKRAGYIDEIPIVDKFPGNDDIHTVTLYVGEKNQSEYYQPVLNLKPERVIFNPGSENFEFAELLEKNGIETIEGCTLVMLSTGQF